MRYHDFHLRGFSSCKGRVYLDLAYDYPGEPKEESQIEFTDVILLQFIHSGGAILTDITEVDLATFVERHRPRLSEIEKAQGLWLWRSDAATYVRALAKEGYRAWEIESAVGFSGFVVGKAVGQKQAEPGASPNGDPADPPGNSEVSGGPPSVS